MKVLELLFFEGRSRMTPRLFTRTFLFTLLVLVAACGYQKAISPAEPKGFIERKEDGLVSEHLPFQYVWRRDTPSAAQERLREQGSYKLYVNRISTAFLDYEGKDESLDDRTLTIAQYLREKIISEVESYDGQYVSAHVVDSRHEADIALDIALVEIGFGSPLLYTGAWVAPVPGVATTVDSMHQPLLAIESRFVDLSTGEPIAEMADRRIPKIRIIDLNKATSKTSPLRDICNTWAKEIAKSMQVRLDKGEEVERESLFSWSLW